MNLFSLTSLLYFSAMPIAWAMNYSDFRRADIEDRRDEVYLEGEAKEKFEEFERTRQYFIRLSRASRTNFVCPKIKAVEAELRSFGAQLEKSASAVSYLSGKGDAGKFFDDYRSRRIDAEEIAEKLEQTRDLSKDGASCGLLTNVLLKNLNDFSKRIHALGTEFYNQGNHLPTSVMSTEDTAQ